MMRISVISAFLAAIVLATLSCGPAEQAAPMNVLFITADDLGLQLSAYGDTVIETPRMDALAASGVQFNIAYVAQASCSPSRSAMFTGLYVHSTGQYGLTPSTGLSLHPHLRDATIPNILKRAGYRTGLIGKLHVAPEESFQFDYVQKNYNEARNVQLVTERAGEFIASAAGQPFFLMVNFSDPHVYRSPDPPHERGFLNQMNGIPEQLVEPGPATVFPFQRIDSPEQQARVAGYYNEVKRVDAGVGMLMDLLDARGLTGNTLVIFVGDHGPPFARGKTTTYEGGLRIPFLVRWPGVSKPMRSDALVSTVDILPTILDATGVAPAVEMQGRSLRPVLTDASAPWREYLAGEFHMHGPSPFFPRRAVRDHRYKLIHNVLAGKAKPSNSIDGDIGYDVSREARFDGTPVRRAFDTLADPPEFELYDLENDPWEFENLAGKPEHKEIQDRLTAALLEWRKETADPFLDPAFLAEMRQRFAPK